MIFYTCFERRRVMWTRSELKERAKAAIKINYWKCVLVALIFAFIAGGISGGSSSSASSFTNMRNIQDRIQRSSYEATDDEGNEYSVFFDGDKVTVVSDSGVLSENEIISITDTEESEVKSIVLKDSEGKNYHIDISQDSVEVSGDTEEFSYDISDENSFMAGVVFLIVFMAVFFSVLVVVVLFDVILYNPLELGCTRFFYKNAEAPANISSIGFGFDHNYKNIIKVMFFRDLHIALWSLLFIIPGIIKAYEYRMVAFILADNPDLDKNTVLKMSKDMMHGNKWKAFVLDLSFIGWEILSIFTCGLLSIFYVAPYRLATEAELYLVLRSDNSDYIDMNAPEGENVDEALTDSSVDSDQNQ